MTRLDDTTVARTLGKPRPLAALLDETAAAIRRFIVLPAGAHAVALALWVAHTHAFEAADCTPYIQLTSAEKRCGKTRLLEVLNHLVAKPWKTGRVTAAVLTRKISKERPTLLLDEFDAALKSGDEYTQTVRGILNAGYERDGKTSVCVVRGKNIGYEDLNVFCPKCLAGIGEMPDTIADRSIRIELRRRKPDGEPVERFRRRTHKEDARLDPGRVRRLGRRRDGHRGSRGRRAGPPERAGRSRPGCVGAVACDRRSLPARPGPTGPGGRQSSSPSERANRRRLRRPSGCSPATKAAFDNARRRSRIPTRDLAAFLARYDEAAFGDYWHDGEITRGASKRIAKGLGRFGITSTTVRTASDESGQTTPRKGYKREDFEDTWARYLAPPPLQPLHPGSHAGLSAASRPLQNPLATGEEQAATPHEQTDVTDVTAPPGDTGQETPPAADATTGPAESTATATPPTTSPPSPPAPTPGSTQ